MDDHDDVGKGRNGAGPGAENLSESERSLTTPRDIALRLITDNPDFPISRAAAAVGVSRPTVYAWMRAAGIDPADRGVVEIVDDDDETAPGGAVGSLRGPEGVSPVVELLTRLQGVERDIAAQRTELSAVRADLARCLGLLEGFMAATQR